MGRAFYEVAVDLWQFIVGSKEVVILVPPAKIEENNETTLIISQSSDKNTALHGQSAFVCKSAPLLVRPLIAFDNQVGEIAYGEPVVILRSEGQYSEIVFKEKLWWIVSDALTLHRNDVYPTFSHQEVLLHDNLETRKLRHCIHDECSGGALFLPLQGLEYLLYRLKEKGSSLVWPINRPRLSGRLQALLKGNKSVHIGIEPKTAAIMEYQDSISSGVLAYVEEVHPDLSIKITSVGKTKEGVFEVETVEEVTWREWRPVFISFK